MIQIHEEACGRSTVIEPGSPPYEPCRCSICEAAAAEYARTFAAWQAEMLCAAMEARDDASV